MRIPKDFTKMNKLAVRDSKPVTINTPYKVTAPWHLAWQEIEKGHYNIVYSPFVPSDNDKFPSLFFYDVEKPFWKLSGKEWSVFKKRCIGFSESVKSICKISETDLDRVKLEKTDGKKYESDWTTLPCIIKLEKMGKGEKYLREAEIRNSNKKDCLWNCAEIRSIISKETVAPCGRCPIE